MVALQEKAAEAGARPVRTFDALIVGAGFAGIYMLHRLRELGFSARVIDAAKGVGGTWYWNRYPGARCDLESLEYQYTFSDEIRLEWKWTERYAAQPEILAYLNFVTDRLDLRRDMQFETRLERAVFDEATNRWALYTNGPEDFSARFLIMASGCLSAPRVPSFKGLESFQGNWYHTGYWPHEGVDFTGRRVGVIGTGSSAIQSIPLIAEQAAHLWVFQRTPNFSIPARNHPLGEDAIATFNQNFDAFLERVQGSGFASGMEPNNQNASDVSAEERERQYQYRWQQGGLSMYLAFADLLFDKDTNDSAADFVRARIREMVKEPATADKLVPTSYPIGTKRICADTNYYDTFNRENVTLVDVNDDPIEEITASGVRTTSAEYELDSIVFATGFDAMTGSLVNVDIEGPGGVTLKEKWSGGPRTYLGLTTAGFPNLFMITGPQSPSVLTNMIRSIEQDVEWIGDCLQYLHDHEVERMEATAEAENEWVGHVDEVANTTLFPLANSWYVGANIPGKARGFMPYVGGFPVYVEKCREVADNNYEGFTLGR
jgi:cyclohexanone monooxygenase